MFYPHTLRAVYEEAAPKFEGDGTGDSQPELLALLLVGLLGNHHRAQLQLAEGLFVELTFETLDTHPVLRGNGRTYYRGAEDTGALVVELLPGNLPTPTGKRLAFRRIPAGLTPTSLIPALAANLRHWAAQYATNAA